MHELQVHADDIALMELPVEQRELVYDYREAQSLYGGNGRVHMGLRMRLDHLRQQMSPAALAIAERQP